MSRAREGYMAEQGRYESYLETLSSLGNAQAAVFSVIEKYQPISNEDIAQILNKYPHTITPRVFELRQLELIEYSGKEISRLSGRMACTWRTKPQDPQLKLF